MHGHKISGRITVLFIIIMLSGLNGNNCFADSGMERHRVIKFERLTTRDGLTTDFTFEILQDRLGLIWIGSNDGLHMYDGYRFTNYQHLKNDPHSLSHNRAWVLMEDSGGVLWIGTGGGGLNRFNRESNTFTRFRISRAGTEKTELENIWYLYEDSAKTIWVGMASKGLFIFDRDSGTFTPCPIAPDIPASDDNHTILYIYEDRAKNIWVGTLAGLFRWNKQNKILEPFEPVCQGQPEGVPIRHTAILQDRAGVLWMGTARGLYIMEPEKRTISHFQNRLPQYRTELSQHVDQIFEDSHGSLWLCTIGGLFRVNAGRDRVYTYKTSLPNIENLPNDRIFRAMEDRSGLIWFTTYSGIAKLNPRQHNFPHYRVNPGPKGYSKDYTFNDRRVQNILEDRRGKLWISTYIRGFYSLDRESGRVTTYRTERGDEPSHELIDMIEDREGFIWIATNAGLKRLNPQSGHMDHYQHRPGAAGSISHSEVLFLTLDREGIVWAGTMDGLNRFDARTQTFRSFRPDPMAAAQTGGDKKSSNRIYAMLQDSSNRFWMGVRNIGLTRFNPDTGIFTKCPHEPGDWLVESRRVIFHIHEDRHGILWLATIHGGLDSYYPETGKYKNYTVESGLPSNVVYGILEDGNGYLWISTTKGLSRFDPKKETFKNYNWFDGLQGEIFSDGACFKSPRTGEMFFGGHNGFNAFFPDKVKDNQHIPTTVVTGFNIFNRPVPVTAGGPLKKNITRATNIKLSYLDSMFTLQFSALEYTDPGSNRFLCKMEGWHDQWIDLGKKSEMTFTGLEPGKYVFRVKGANNDGIWDPEGVAIDVIITPPFWKAFWFRILIILLAVSLLVIWHRGRVKKLTLRYKTEAEMNRVFARFKISEREQEIVRLMIEGKSNKEIEDVLYISLSTVKTHVYNIYQKLGVKNRLELINLLRKAVKG